MSINWPWRPLNYHKILQWTFCNQQLSISFLFNSLCFILLNMWQTYPATYITKHCFEFCKYVQFFWCLKNIDHIFAIAIFILQHTFKTPPKTFILFCKDRLTKYFKTHLCNECKPVSKECLIQATEKSKIIELLCE